MLKCEICGVISLSVRDRGEGWITCDKCERELMGLDAHKHDYHAPEQQDGRGEEIEEEGVHGHAPRCAPNRDKGTPEKNRNRAEGVPRTCP